ncbi:putative alcohol dehydrogenase [Periconia macrospinosa]|uniref:Putative alcohol dehydrogenase n=1 Tax=Periconia macrospinosa TaxID=97972 RepID=A0A2V1D6R8_9PLEO|nr:putative alcohol dehydrogenase [Periconia macrospinosa]
MASQTQAIVVLKPGEGAGVQTVPLPKLREGWVLVDVKAIALNPSDWKKIDYGAADLGSRVGCDYAGVVREVGPQVSNFKKGDRIGAFVHGADRTNHDNGAFAGVIVAKTAIQFHIPDNISFEEAATLGVALVTVGQSLYKTLQLPLPTAPAEKPFPILIYAASTAVGMYGIQFAKASGLKVIATCSPHNFEKIRALGADVVFDYSSPSCAADIKAYTNNQLRYSWDCMATGGDICAKAMSDQEKSYYTTINSLTMKSMIAMRKGNPKMQAPQSTMGYDAFGDPYMFLGKTVPAKPDEMQYATKFIEISRSLLEKGVVKPISISVNQTGGGLEGALRGLDELRAGRVSGSKLVYTL